MRQTVRSAPFGGILSRFPRVWIDLAADFRKFHVFNPPYGSPSGRLRSEPKGTETVHTSTSAGYSSIAAAQKNGNVYYFPSHITHNRESFVNRYSSCPLMRNGVNLDQNTNFHVQVTQN